MKENHEFFSKCSPSIIYLAFSVKLVLEDKVWNRAFRKILNVTIYHIFLSLISILTEVLKDTLDYPNYQLLWVWIKLRWQICFYRQSFSKYNEILGILWILNNILSGVEIRNCFVAGCFKVNAKWKVEKCHPPWLGDKENFVKLNFLNSLNAILRALHRNFICLPRLG